MFIHPYIIPGIRSPKKNKITFKDIEDVIADQTEFEWKRLIGKSRKREIVMMRHVICYVIYNQDEKVRPSLKEIGEWLGGRDHTTVLNSIGVVNDLKDTQYQLVNDYIDLFQRYL